MHFLGHNVPYMNSVTYNLPDDGLIQAKTGRKDIINYKQLIIIGCEICWIKYYLFGLLHAAWITLNLIMLPHAPLGVCRVL
jgi:hypothetical protein